MAIDVDQRGQESSEVTDGNALRVMVLSADHTASEHYDDRVPRAALRLEHGYSEKPRRHNQQVMESWSRSLRHINGFVLQNQVLPKTTLPAYQFGESTQRAVTLGYCPSLIPVQLSNLKE